MKLAPRIALTAAALLFVGRAATSASEYSDQVDRIPFRDCHTLTYELKCPLVIAAMAITPEQSERLAAAIEDLKRAGAEKFRKREGFTPEQ